MASKWHRIGWQGIEMTVPADWDIAAVSGKGSTKGYLRVEDSELPRVEMKWAYEDGFVDLEKMVDDYLKKLKKGEKGGPEIEINEDAQVVSKRKMQKKSLRCFEWFNPESDLRGHGAAWFCSDCRHAVITQVTAKEDEDGEAIAERIISSIQDHGSGEWVRWATWSFDAQTPTGFEMTASKLMAGHIQLTFKRDAAAEDARSIMLQNIAKPEELTLGRWAPANVVLKDMTLREWAEEEMGTGLKRAKPEIEETEIRGHQGLAVTAQRLWAHQKLFRTICRFAEVPFADRIRGRIWHCPESNSLHLVQMLIDRTSEHLPDEVVERFICHHEEDDEQ
ncbi:MAG: hypothetical protein ACLFWB_03665 [Armatimonadota bacterium]